MRELNHFDFTVARREDGTFYMDCRQYWSDGSVVLFSAVLPSADELWKEFREMMTLVTVKSQAASSEYPSQEQDLTSS